jgi:hypothetical protein
MTTRRSPFSGSRIQTEDEAFDAWFRNSKAIDETGRPKIFFHGTTATKHVPGVVSLGDERAKAELKALAHRYGIGEWDAVASIFERWTEMGQAERFGVTVEMALEARRLTDAAKDYREQMTEVLAFDTFRMPKGDTELGIHLGTREQALSFGTPFPMYLSVQNPLRLPDLGTWRPHLVVTAIHAVGIRLTSDEIEKVRMATDQNSAMRDLIEDKGYDSIVYENEAEGRGDSYIVLRPAQIRSATTIMQKQMLATSGLQQSNPAEAAGATDADDQLLSRSVKTAETSKPKRRRPSQWI